MDYVFSPYIKTSLMFEGSSTLKHQLLTQAGIYTPDLKEY